MDRLGPLGVWKQRPQPVQGPNLYRCLTDGKIGFITVCAALVRIIDNTGCDEIFVWDNDPTSVICFKDHGSCSGFHNCACFTAIKFDIIPNGCLPSNKRITPEMKFDAIFCKPKPRPTPTALPKYGKRGQGNPHDVHQDQKGRAENGNLGCLAGQLTGGGAHFFLFVDKARGLIV